jgi:hypothetical protein
MQFVLVSNYPRAMTVPGSHGMDPLSVLSATSAAAQLLNQGIQINNFLYHLYSKPQEAPEVVQKQIIQVEQLIGLARLIIQNPTLQNVAIVSVTWLCLRSARQSQALLTKISVTKEDGKLQKLQEDFAALIQEKEFIKHFDALKSFIESLHSRSRFVSFLSMTLPFTLK